MKVLAIFLACIFLTARSSHADDICDLITITSSVLVTKSGKKFICPNTTSISFHCTVINTSTLVWESEEYIGQNRQITFNLELEDREGVGKKIDQKPTFAQLLNVECSSESLCRLTSDLRITDVSHSTVSIQCGYNHGIFSPMNIAHSAIPHKPQVQEPLLIGQNEKQSFYLVEWEPSINSNSFELDYYHMRLQYSNGSDFDLTVLMNNGIIVLLENGSVNVSIATISTCGQKGEYDFKLISSTIKPPDGESQCHILLSIGILATSIALILFGTNILAILCCATKKRSQHRETIHDIRDKVNFIAVHQQPNANNQIGILRAGMKAIATLFIPQDQPLGEESEPLLKRQHTAVTLTQSHPNQKLQKQCKPTSDLDPTKMAICNAILRIFERHGAVALKTPFLECQDITDNQYKSEGTQLFYFTSHGTVREDYTLRYDLTVPFARYLAKNDLSELKRYQIDGVYRNDKRAQRDIGTSWEYYQCDFDIAGDFDPMVADAECLKIVVEILSELEFKDIVIKVSHFNIVKGILDKCGCSEEKFFEICARVEDHPDNDWIKVCEESLNAKDLKKLKKCMKKKCRLSNLNESGLLDFARDEVEKMQKLLEYCQAFGIHDKVHFDPALSFRLGYYTGLIFEASDEDGKDKQTTLAAGGRYDKMVEEITPGHSVHCVGFTVDIEEIFKCLSERENMKLESVRKLQTQVFVASDEGNLKERIELCAGLWEAKIAAEFMYKEAPKMDEQMQYCNKNDIPFCVIVRHGEWQIRDVKTGCEECFTASNEVIGKLTKELRERKEMSLFMSKPAS